MIGNECDKYYKLELGNEFVDNTLQVATMPLKKTKYNALEVNLKRCEVFVGMATKCNDRSSRVYVPPQWEGKKVYVVLKDE